MRSVGAFVLAVLAGCSSDGAIEIVVDTQETGVDEVKLYVGLGSTMNENHDVAELLVPPDYPHRGVQPSGFAWKRDEAAGPTGDRATVVDGEARFVFQPGTHDRITVIVVGYKDGAVAAASLLEDAFMEGGTVRQYIVELAPATPAFPDTTRGGISVQEWGPADADAICAHYRDTESSVYVVTKNDRDCDGFGDDEPEKTKECRTEAYRGFVRAVREKHACITRETLPPLTPTGTTVDAMLLGGPGCVDGRGTDDKACDLGTTCVAEDARACETAERPLDCFGNLALTTQSAIHMRCKFGYEVNNGQNMFCPGAAGLMVGKLPPALLQLACDPTKDFLFWAVGGEEWKASALVKGAMTFTATRPTDVCTWQLAASGAPQNGLAVGVLSVPMKNGRSIAIPIEIETGQVPISCSETPANFCVIEPSTTTAVDGSLARCLRSDIVEPW